jgi:hypothetical protein
MGLSAVSVPLAQLFQESLCPVEGLRFRLVVWLFHPVGSRCPEWATLHPGRSIPCRSAGLKSFPDSLPLRLSRIQSNPHQLPFAAPSALPFHTFPRWKLSVPDSQCCCCRSGQQS